MCPDLWPNLGTITVDPDIYFGSASQLKGEQNINLPSVGSKLHAAPSTPQHFSLLLLPSVPSPLDTLMHKNLLYGETAATERHTTEDHHPKLWKLPNLQSKDLQEAGGVFSALGNVPVIPEGPDPLGLAGVVMNMDLRKVKPSCVNAHEQGGVSPIVGAALALAEGTAGIGPTGKAETATTTEPKVLVPRVQDKVRRRREVDAPPQEALLQKGKCNTKALSQKCKLEHCPNEDKRKSVQLLQEAPQQDKGTLEMLPQNHQCKHDATLQGNPSVSALSIWDPGGRLPSDDIVESKGPVEAMDIVLGIVAHKKTPGCAELNQSASTIPKSQPHTFISFSIRRLGLLSSRSPFVFIFCFEAH